MADDVTFEVTLTADQYDYVCEKWHSYRMADEADEVLSAVGDAARAAARPCRRQGSHASAHERRCGFDPQRLRVRVGSRRRMDYVGRG